MRVTTYIDTHTMYFEQVHLLLKKKQVMILIIFTLGTRHCCDVESIVDYRFPLNLNGSDVKVQNVIFLYLCHFRKVKNSGNNILKYLRDSLRNSRFPNLINICFCAAYVFSAASVIQVHQFIVIRNKLAWISLPPRHTGEGS